MAFNVWEDPFSGVAESAQTSRVLAAWDAHDVSLSFYLSSGTSSIFTYQVSGASRPTPDASIPEASWSNWTRYIGASGISSSASILEPPLTYPWHRIIRLLSGGSFTYNWNKQVYGPGAR